RARAGSSVGSSRGHMSGARSTGYDATWASQNWNAQRISGAFETCQAHWPPKPGAVSIKRLFARFCTKDRWQPRNANWRCSGSTRSSCAFGLLFLLLDDLVFAHTELLEDVVVHDEVPVAESQVEVFDVLLAFLEQRLILVVLALILFLDLGALVHDLGEFF